jgi:tripartite-type tricarboxylate transporter receptor subunit TctC
MRNSVLGGHVQMMFDAITTIQPMMRAGQVRPIGTTGQKRSPATPDVPTISEGGASGFETNIWFGLMAPAGTPKEIVATLERELGKVLARPDVRDLWGAQGVTTWSGGGAELDRFLREDIVKWEKVVKASGIRLN